MPPRNLFPRPSPLDAPATRPPMSMNSQAAWTTFFDFDISASASRRASGTLARPTFGSLVANGYGAASAPPPARALNSDDLPALGRPTNPNFSIGWRLPAAGNLFGCEQANRQGQEPRPPQEGQPRRQAQPRQQEVASRSGEPRRRRERQRAAASRAARSVSDAERGDRSRPRCGSGTR